MLIKCEPSEDNFAVTFDNVNVDYIHANWSTSVNIWIHRWWYIVQTKFSLILNKVYRLILHGYFDFLRHSIVWGFLQYAVCCIQTINIDIFESLLQMYKHSMTKHYVIWGSQTRCDYVTIVLGSLALGVFLSSFKTSKPVKYGKQKC